MRLILILCIFVIQSTFAGEVYIQKEEADQKADRVKEKYTSEQTTQSYSKKKRKTERSRNRGVPQIGPCQTTFLSLGGQLSYMQLRTKSTSNAMVGADQDTRLGGMLGGAQAVFEYKKFRSLYTGILTNFLTGSISRSSGNMAPDRTVWDVEAEGRFGYNYRGLQGNRMEVTPYIGFGFSYFQTTRKANATAGKIDFIDYTYYLPVGFMINYAFYSWFNAGFNFKWFPDLDPTLKTSLFKGNRFVLQKENGQLFVEVPFIFRFGSERQGFLSFVPYWKRKKNGSTSAQTLGNANVSVPKQTHIYWGGSVNLGYSF